ncbi:hypothetical protein [Piscinibacter sp. XHJ-5]|uniref:hypothetical protein n=1 Tax=Piscinibacter sp. XHJ-5 TaxID=3037797 RepID=UPI002452DF4D|nr:hypothetical protein [Piscinibacter sp. XHJ-5]
MKPTEFYRWETWAETGPRKRIKTRYLMTREQALERDPTSTPVPGTLEIRNLPENEYELLGMTHTGRGQPKGSSEAGT